MEARKISRRSAIRKMAAAAGVAAFSQAPSLASVLSAKPEDVDSIPQNDPTVSTLKMEDFKLVYEGPDVVFHQINDHLWIGNGHLMYNESVYLVEGEKSALLIDTGTRIANLDGIVAQFTDKPIDVALTHTHGDHAGSVGCFDHIWMTQAEGISVPRGYTGRVSYMDNHQKFDLGGRTLEVFYAPGHTTDSVLFIDEANHIGISGDAFGSTNLLMNCNLSTFINTARETLEMMYDKKIYYMLPGHFDGTNAETTKRVYDLWNIAQGVLDGKLVGEPARGNLNRIYTYQGVRFNYSDKKLM
jgi:glyoxylase-like metal-dependent hydrolase (beta-lactamase superfamily II)